MSSATTRQDVTAVDELALFHRTLAEMCRNDVPLPKAFRVLQADLKRGELRDAVGAMAEEVEQGMPFAEAYAARRAHFPQLYCRLIEVGLQCGDLPGVLEEIARHAAQRAHAQQRIRKALAYPLVSAAFVVAVGVVLLTYVGPKLWSLPEGVVLADGAPIVKVALGALAVLAGAAFVFGWLRGVPVLGRLRRYAAKSSFTATLALLLRRDVPLPTALRLAADACEDESLAGLAESADRGEGLGEVLRHAEVLPPTLLWLVGMAEGSKDTPRALDEVAAIYSHRLDRALDRFATIITPVAEIVVGVVVFCFAYSFMVPLFEYAEGLFR